MKASSSNWGNLKSKISKESSNPVSAKSSSSTGSSSSAPTFHREKRTDLNQACKGVDATASKVECETKDEKKMGGDHMTAKMKSNYVGLDCEMVGIGLSGKQSALARCCIVDFDGLVIFDKYVRPKGFVTDFRTQWSGIRKQDLRAGEAITLLECQENVTALLKDKYLVGHALKNDLDVLMLSHPKKMIRDTATFKPYMRGEDARCAMFLYRLKMKEWEVSMKEARALQSAAFKHKPAAATSSSGSGASGSAETGPAPPSQPLSSRALAKESGLSGKERRNLRRNGPPTLSRAQREELAQEAEAAGGGGGGVAGGGGGEREEHRVHSIQSSRGLGAGRGARPQGQGGVRSERDMAGSGSGSEHKDVNRKRKAVSSSVAPSGMFLNDAAAAVSFSDIDRIMGNTLSAHTTHTNSAKKPRR